MSLLLDTHVVLWWLADSDELSDDIKQRLSSEVAGFVSAASVWEVGIKQAQGKLSASVDLAEAVANSGFQFLAINAEHAIAAARLPLLHRDPFDRMLIGQAMAEGLTIVTRDRLIQSYDIPTLAV